MKQVLRIIRDLVRLLVVRSQNVVKKIVHSYGNLTVLFMGVQCFELFSEQGQSIIFYHKRVKFLFYCV